MAETIPHAPITPSAWNRWLIAVNMDVRDTDQLQRVTEFFRDRVFPAAGISEDYLAQLSVAPVTGLHMTAPLPGGIPPIYGAADLVPVKFWAPATAHSLPWPYDPPGMFSSGDRAILYQVFEADKKAPTPREQAEQEHEERPQEEPSAIAKGVNRGIAAAVLFGGGLLLWRILGVIGMSKARPPSQ